MEQFTNPGDTVLDQFAGSYYTYRALMLHLHYCRCVVAESDPVCNKYVLQTLIEFFERQLLNKNADITRSYEMKVAVFPSVQSLLEIQS